MGATAGAVHGLAGARPRERMGRGHGIVHGRGQRRRHVARCSRPARRSGRRTPRIRRWRCSRTTAFIPPGWAPYGVALVVYAMASHTSPVGLTLRAGGSTLLPGQVAALEAGGGGRHRPVRIAVIARPLARARRTAILSRRAGHRPYHPSRGFDAQSVRPAGPHRPRRHRVRRARAPAQCARARRANCPSATRITAAPARSSAGLMLLATSLYLRSAWQGRD